MNKERILKVADAIERHPEHFDMSYFYNAGESPYTARMIEDALAMEDCLDHCGTTACIAGWAMHLWPDEARSRPWGVTYSAVAADILGLDHDLADDIFFDFDLEDAAEAAQYLRDLVEAS